MYSLANYFALIRVSIKQNYKFGKNYDAIAGITTEIFSGHRNALADAFLKLCRFVFGLVGLKT